MGGWKMGGWKVGGGWWERTKGRIHHGVVSLACPRLLEKNNGPLPLACNYDISPKWPPQNLPSCCNFSGPRGCQGDR